MNSFCEGYRRGSTSRGHVSRSADHTLTFLLISPAYKVNLTQMRKIQEHNTQVRSWRRTPRDIIFRHGNTCWLKRESKMCRVRSRSRDRESGKRHKNESRELNRRLEIDIIALTQRWDNERCKAIIRRRFLEIVTDGGSRQPTMAWANSHRELTDFWVLTEGPGPNTFSYCVHEINDDSYVVHILGPTEYLRERFLGKWICPWPGR